MIRTIKKSGFGFEVGDIVRFRNVYWAKEEGFRVRPTYDLRVLRFRKNNCDNADRTFEGKVVRVGDCESESLGDIREPFVRAFEKIEEGK